MINIWLDNFELYWTEKKVDDVLLLFEESVDYWENPYKKINGIDELKSEWLAIESQKNIKIKTKIFSTNLDKHTVIWELSYMNKFNREEQWAGCYLIRLNDAGKCTYFYQVGEKH